MALDCFFPFAYDAAPVADSLHIKVALLRSGRTQRSVAADLGVSEAYLSLVIAGKRKAPAVRRRFTELTGIPIQEAK